MSFFCCPPAVQQTASWPSYYPIRGSDPLEVLNQIASYVYILAFAGSLVVVVLVELAEHAGGPRGPSRSGLRALG